MLLLGAVPLQLLYDMMVMDDQINKEHLNYLATHTPVTDSGTGGQGVQACVLNAGP
jgi:hypothetical protein